MLINYIYYSAKLAKKRSRKFFLHASHEITRFWRSKCMKIITRNCLRAGLLLIQALCASRQRRDDLSFLEARSLSAVSQMSARWRPIEPIRVSPGPPSCGFISTSLALPRSPCLSRTNIQTGQTSKGTAPWLEPPSFSKGSNSSRFRARAILARKKVVCRYIHTLRVARVDCARICPDKGAGVG